MTVGVDILSLKSPEDNNITNKPCYETLINKHTNYKTVHTTVNILLSNVDNF